jgi:hypothetical protein
MADLETRLFVCASCGEKCYSPWSEEQAIAEYERVTGKTWKAEEVIEICDDCYRLMTGAKLN